MIDELAKIFEVKPENLMSDSFTFKTVASDIAEYEAYTKPEVKRLLGIFLNIPLIATDLSSDTEFSDNQSSFMVALDNVNLFGFDYVHSCLIAKNDARRLEDVIWKFDKPVKNSNLKFSYQDARGAVYSVGFTCIFEKK